MSYPKRSIVFGKPIFYLLALLVFISIYELGVSLTKRNVTLSSIELSAEKQLDKLSAQTYLIDKQIGITIFEEKDTYNWNVFDKFLKDLPQAVVIRKGDSLIYWNHSDWPQSIGPEKDFVNPIVQKFPSGFFLIYQHKINGLSIGIFSKLQNIFPLQNEFLTNSYTKLFFLKEGGQLSTSPVLKDGKNISKYGIWVTKDKAVINTTDSPGLILAFLLSYVCMLLLLYSIYKQIDRRTNGRYKTLLGILYLALIIVVRVLDYSFGVPAYVKQMNFFHQIINGVTGFNSWGNLVLNAFVLLLFLYQFRAIIINYKLPKKNRLLWGILIGLLLLLIPYLFYALTNRVLSGSNESNLLQLTFFSIYGLKDLLFIFVLNGLIYLWVQTLLAFAKDNQFKYVQLIIILIVESVFLYLIFKPETEFMLLSLLIVLALTTVIWFLSFRNSPYLFTVIILFILSVAGAYLFNLTKLETKNAQQRLTLSLISQKKDPYFEFRLQKLSHEILSDTNLLRLLDTTPAVKEGDLSDYLNKKYFNRYFKKYSRQIIFCRPWQKLAIQPDNELVACDAYFSRLDSKPVIVSPKFSLSIINDPQESLYYLATFHFHGSSDTVAVFNLYVEFFADFLPKGLGYPELLIDAKQNNLHLSGYSFARYSNRMLQYTFGDYLYPSDFAYFANHPADHFFFMDEFRHLIHFTSANDELVISRPKATVSQWLLPFSLLFLFSGFIIILITSVVYGQQLRKLIRYSLRARLQLIFFSAVLTIFVALAIVTLYYFNNANQSRINTQLKEKAHSVLIELQEKFANFETIKPKDKPFVQNYLQKLSMVFFSDINLYDTSGRLIASSRPEIFQKDLQSVLINPAAFNRICLKHQLFFLSRERIGKSAFYSSYMPLTLANGHEAGVINLPFFARQSEIQHSYYEVLANLINLFVLTGILGLIFMMFLSKILTKPLKILQNKIKLVGIDKNNEKIEWKDNDEIGQLIDAYNQMVEKLENSTQLLKASEREKAWREMARQIAHEIRNPLTPMKLNVQYLENAYRQGDEKFDEKLKNISQSLITQIDTLNEVAGMFADFSRTGLRQKQSADLGIAIQNAMTLFKKSYDINFVFEKPTDSPLLVNASEQDLLRIFTNLLKNSIQAMEEQHNMMINIKIYKQGDDWVVQVSDKGKGINPQHISRIFQPYFTTKTTGTGLGLAIVKNMMNEMGGEVSFESEQGRGTTFTLKFQAGHSQ